MQKLNKVKPFVKQVISDEFYANVVNIISPGQLYIQSVIISFRDEKDLMHG